MQILTFLQLHSWCCVTKFGAEPLFTSHVLELPYPGCQPDLLPPVLHLADSFILPAIPCASKTTVIFSRVISPKPPNQSLPNVPMFDVQTNACIVAKWLEKDWRPVECTLQTQLVKSCCPTHGTLLQLQAHHAELLDNGLVLGSPELGGKGRGD